MNIKKKFQGLHANRYKREPLEKVFAEMWQKQNDEKLNHNTILDYLLSETVDQHNPEKRSDEDYIKAATLIQWLGSTVGQCFLRDVFKEARRKSVAFPMVHEILNSQRKDKQMSLRFICPDCEHRELAEIMVDATVSSIIEKIPEKEFDIEYSDVDVEDGCIGRYQCNHCGFILRRNKNNGEPINNFEDLLWWLDNFVEQHHIGKIPE